MEKAAIAVLENIKLLVELSVTSFPAGGDTRDKSGEKQKPKNKQKQKHQKTHIAIVNKMF